jgi:hypothetical protein
MIKEKEEPVEIERIRKALSTPSSGLVDEAEKRRKELLDELTAPARSTIDEMVKIVGAGISAEAAKRMVPDAGLSSVIDHMTASSAFRKATERPHSFPRINLPTAEEQNHYRSAKVLLESLYRYYTEWSERIQSDGEVVIYALLPTGAVIKAKRLIEEGFNGIAIEGDIGGAECVLLLNQSTLQFLCVVEQIVEEERKKIGFIFAEDRENEDV